MSETVEIRHIPVFTDPRTWSTGVDHESFARLRAECPVAWQDEPPTEWFPSGGPGYWSVFGYEDVVAVSRDQETFTSAHGTEIVDMTPEQNRLFGGMLNMGSAEHGRHRAIVNRVLTPRSVMGMTEQIRGHAIRAIDRVTERGSCDLVLDMVGDFPAQIICDLLGVPTPARSRLIALTNEAFESYGSEASLQAIQNIVDYAHELLAQTRRDPVEGAAFLQKLLVAEIGGERLSDQDIAYFFALLATAGIDTTATALAQGMRALALFPEQRKRWQESFDELAGAAVEEIVRWVSPVMHFRRTATRDVELHGQQIKAGDKVVLWYVSANRDESVFDAPHEFRLDRDGSHVGFGGGGPHFCLGAVLARAELKIFFQELFRMLPDIEVDGDPIPVPSNFVNGLRSLPVRYTPRTRSAETEEMR
jgi:cytochrome P450